MDRLDGLIFSGGPDIDPAVYGHPRHPQLGPDVDRISDEYELALLAIGSLLRRITRASTLEVNSYHHQSVDRLGRGLEICAVALALAA